ncbi:winged helix-turn-helix domain-containing protein, partial [Spirillospora sp. NPDC127506]
MPEHWSSSVDLHLDVDTSRGRRAGLERALRDAIATGRLASGAALPSTRALAAELGFSRGTVTAAYDQLTAEGHLITVPGSGTRVAEHPGPVRAARGAVPGDTRPPAHDLRPGRPDLSAFPSAAWLRATRRALAAAPPVARLDAADRRRPLLAVLRQPRPAG